MKTNSAIILFATAALLSLIIIIYRDYCSTIYVKCTLLKFFVLSYEEENGEEALRSRGFNQTRSWHICIGMCGRLRM